MSKSRSRQLCDYSLSMALAAIEIYNKPGFSCREPAFCVQMVNAWESLAKARILQLSNNRLQCIRIKDDSGWRYKTTRHGDYMTIDGLRAVKEVIDSPVVINNIDQLMRIRNSCVHHLPPSRGLTQLVHALAISTLDNFAHYIKEWFGTSVADLNFYILPLGFSYPFTKLSAINLSKETGIVQEIIRAITVEQREGRQFDGERSLVLEIGVDMISAKKTKRNADLDVNVTNEPTAERVQTIYKDFNDRYPYNHRQMLEKIKTRDPHCRQSQVNKIIAQQGIKDDDRYSGYLYMDRMQRERGKTKSTPSRYNDDAIRFIVSTFQSMEASREAAI